MGGADRGFAATLLRLGLGMLSLPYSGVIGLRNQLYDTGWLPVHRAGVPVVSVGNLTVGGTGKTPAVEYLAAFYRRLDLRVAILSRGYAALNEANDEALVLRTNLPDVPHLQGRDRVALAQRACRELESDVLILDDAFQHRRLGRDLDIVLIDATRPWGHKQLLPRGLLREPAANLARADVVLLSRVDQVDSATLRQLRIEIGQCAPGKPVAQSVHRPLEWLDAAGQSTPLEALADRPLAAFCGIGNPEAFRRSLLDLRVKPRAWRSFPDHHRYTPADLSELEHWAAGLPPDAAIATTQKDLVKLRCQRLADRPVLALRIGLEIAAGKDWFEETLSLVAPRLTRQASRVGC